MADYEKEGEETSAHGVDWEVVSLTASAYAAAPGLEGIDLDDESKDKEFNENVEELARAMFMSGHFVFPPSEHEDLPLESDDGEIIAKFRAPDADMIEQEADVPVKTQEENWKSESLSGADDLHVIQFLDKGERPCADAALFEKDVTTLQGLKLVKEGRAMDSDSRCSSFRAKMVRGESVVTHENRDIEESENLIKQNLGFSPRFTNQPKHTVSRVPSESWWKRRAALLYAHAKDAGTLWSLCVAAALMGLVILGRRWQRERWQVHSINDEKISRILGPVTRFKNVIVGNHGRAAVLQGNASSGH